MHNDPDTRPRQPRRFRRLSAVTLLALIVAVLLERRKRTSQPAPSAVFDHETFAGFAPAAAADVDVPAHESEPEPFVFEPAPESHADAVEADSEPFAEQEPAELPAPSPLTWGFGPSVADGPFEQFVEPMDTRAEVEVDATVEAPFEAPAEVEAEAVAVEDVPVADDQPVVESAPVVEPAPVPDRWFGSFAAPAPWSPVEVPAAEEPVVEEPVAEELAADEPVAAWPIPYAPPVEVPAIAPADEEPVVELPQTPAEPTAQPDSGGPFRHPPAHLRRYLGTGLSTLLIAVVLGAGVLVSGATADSTSDPSTVPDAVATLADGTVVPDGATPPADTTTTSTDPSVTTAPADTTTTGTTTTDTTTTDTTTTDTTTTDTTTTSTTSTDPTATTSTDSTSTTSTDPVTTTTATDPSAPVAPPTDTTAVAPVAPAAPVATPPAPATVAPAPTTTTPAVDVPKPKSLPSELVVPKHPKARVTPAKAIAPATTDAATHPAAKKVTPAVKQPPVVTLASGADPIGSLLSRNAAIPAVDSSLLPTPAQVSFYVKASKPLAKLPTLRKLDHLTTQRLVRVGRTSHVSWTVLAAVARLESNLGSRKGLLAGRHLKTATTGDGLVDLATFLRQHHAGSNPVKPGKSRTALVAYFGSARKANRAIALAALYGALGSFGIQHGVRAENGRLQRRVLRDHRIHLTTEGRGDITHGRVDPRVLVTLEYLADSFNRLRVSDLVSGGQLFSRSGAVSAHLYGRAVDVSSLRGVKVKGHQGPGTLTEQAIRRLLLLPKSLRPRQVISLMDVDGPTGNRGSFALPDHYDRIQIDY
jgi:hypothetical protein